MSGITKAQIAAQCPKGGVHDWECTWPAPQTYIETCKKCGEVRNLDETLGMGRVDKIGKRIRGQTVMVAGSHIHCMTDTEYTERTGRKRGREK